MATTTSTTQPRLHKIKLRPPRSIHPTIDRPRINALFEKTLDVPVTMVVSPGGFGKTTAVSAWLASTGTAYGWLTVDGSDRELLSFVTHFVAAIRIADPGAGLNTLALSLLPNRPSPTDLAETLSDELMDLESPVVVVIDDAHEILPGTALEFLDHLIRFQADNLHLILIGQHDPPLSIARLRVQGRVQDIRAADLRFDQEEIEHFLVSRHLKVPPNLPAALLETTGGWAIGVRIAVDAIDGDKSPSQHGSGRNDQYSKRFVDLLEAALDTLPTELRDLVFLTTLIGSMCSDLANALVAELKQSRSVSEMLDDLAAADLFIRPDPVQPGWFFPRPGINPLLEHQIGIRFDIARRNAIKATAFRWLVAHGQLNRAIPVGMTAGIRSEVVVAVEQAIQPALERERWPDISSWLTALPEEAIVQSPELSLARCWVAYFTGKWSVLGTRVTEVQSQLSLIAKDDQSCSEDIAELELLRYVGVVPIERDPAVALTVLAALGEKLPKRKRFVYAQIDNYVALSLLMTGKEEEAVSLLLSAIERGADQWHRAGARSFAGLLFVQRLRGQHAMVCSTAKEVTQKARQYDLPLLLGWSLLHHGWALYEANDLDGAETVFSELAQEADRIHLAAAREGMIGLALVHLANNRDHEVDATFRRTRELMLERDAIELMSGVSFVEARIAISRGRTNEVSGVLQQRVVDLESISLVAFIHPLIERIKILISMGREGDLDEARLHLEALGRRLDVAHIPVRVPEFLALEALLLDARSDRTSAVERAQRALSHPVSRSGRLTRVFLDLGPPFIELVEMLANDTSDPAAVHLLRQHQPRSPDSDAASPSEPAPDSISTRRTTLNEILTDREFSVLEGLGHRLSYKEIGDQLFISPLTVKRHASNIYLKLGAENRRHAVALAQEQGWRPE